MAVLFLAVILAEQPSLQHNRLDQNSTTLSRPQEKTSVATSEAPQQQGGIGLVAAFELITPQQTQSCQKLDPWVQGEQIAMEQQILPTGGCFAIRIQAAAKDLFIHLFAYSADDTLVRLFPNACNAMGPPSVQPQLTKEQKLQLPQTAKGTNGALGFGGNPGQEWIYLVASESAQVHQDVGTAMQTIQDVCSANADKMSQTEFEQRLRQLQLRFPNSLQWQVKSLKHE